MYYLGIDLGSSSIKIALVNSSTGAPIATVSEPAEEMNIIALEHGWAEQDPNVWWDHTCKGIKRIFFENEINGSQIKGIGISYQMHGLVVVDKDGHLIKNSIIWCDSRAVDIGEKAFNQIGTKKCQDSLLNSPANFTASKLKWIQENEPEIYSKIDKMMLPGDFLAFKLSDEITTTINGLSEGVMWDFTNNQISEDVISYFGFEKRLIPTVKPAFSIQSTTSVEGAKACGLVAGTPILYRSGDQPNNAFSMNVMEPGEVAATGGTSGVLYAVTDSLISSESVRVNNFAHVNHTYKAPRIGKLLNINGAGILYRWLRKNLNVLSYEDMNQKASDVDIGADGVVIIPFGNGSERMLDNRSPGMHIAHVNYNRHHVAHLCRAALEGIAFSFVYGMELLKNDNAQINSIRAGNDNLFRSDVFSQTIATLINHKIEIYDTTGAIGAARAAGLTSREFTNMKEIVKNDLVKVFKPELDRSSYTKAYERWKSQLETILNEI